MNKKLIYIIVSIVILNLTFISAIDVSVNVLKEYERVKAGEKVYFTFEIIDPENPGTHDIFLEYEIKKGNEIIIGKTETKGVGIQLSWVKSILIPENAQSGIYSIIVTVDDKASGSSIFYVEKQINYFLIIIVITIIGFLLTWLLVLYRMKKSMKK